MPVISETYDGVLNDINGMHIKEEHVWNALNHTTSGAIAEGNVGGGTGMICYEFKGGTGTSSRKIEIEGETYTVGVLVQANYGRRPWLSILGVPVGEAIPTEPLLDHEMGSIVVIIATDIPMLPHQLRRLAKRGAIGIGRSGSPGGNDSGDLFLAFSTANEQRTYPHEPAQLTMTFMNDDVFDPIYEQTVHAIDEAVVNALFAAESMTTVKGPKKTIPALPKDEVLSLFRQVNRIK